MGVFLRGVGAYDDRSTSIIRSAFVKEGITMATKGEMFAGLSVAMITPFKDGLVDYDGLRKLVDWHIAEGTDCLVPCGTTGESPTLDHEEHEKVIAVVTDHA